MDTVGLCAYHWARKGTEIRKQVNNSRSPSWAGQALWHWETGKDHPCAIAVVCIRSARDTGDTGGGSSKATVPIPHSGLQPHGQGGVDFPWPQRWLRVVPTAHR